MDKKHKDHKHEPKHEPKPEQKHEPKHEPIETVEITGKAAEGGLPHGPPPGKYDQHETDVLNKKAEDQLRVLKDRNTKKEDAPNA